VLDQVEERTASRWTAEPKYPTPALDLFSRAAILKDIEEARDERMQIGIATNGNYFFSYLTAWEAVLGRNKPGSAQIVEFFCECIPNHRTDRVTGHSS